jgi:hypothetical protein
MAKKAARLAKISGAKIFSCNGKKGPLVGGFVALMAIPSLGDGKDIIGFQRIAAIWSLPPEGMILMTDDSVMTIDDFAARIETLVSDGTKRP